MSQMSDSPHARYTTYNRNLEREHKKYCDPITGSVLANGWGITRKIDEDGRITLSAGKHFGEFKDDFFDGAEIEIIVKSTNFKAPQIKAIKESDSQLTVKFVEIPDGKGRMSESLEKDRFIERQYKESSILTVKEYLAEQFPEFDEIVTIPKLNQIIAKIKDEMGNVQRNRDKYQVSKHWE